MTTGASTSFETTANITSVNAADGRNGPQWILKVKWPWTGGNYDDSVYLEQSAFPTQPSNGIYRVEVAFRSLKNKQEGGKHSGTHYWMVNYFINKIGEQANQMNPQPTNSSIWPGKEDEAARNSDAFSGNTGNAPAPSGNAPAIGNGGHPDPSAPYDLLRDRNYGQIKGHCENAVIAMMDKLPGLFDEEGNANWNMFVFHRDEFYNNFSAIDITVYDQEVAEVAEATGLVEEAKKLGAEAFLATMDNAPPPAPAPEPAAHICEKHKIEYTRYSDGRYGHRWGENKYWCIEGNESLLNDKGEPVTEATML